MVPHAITLIWRKNKMTVKELKELLDQQDPKASIDVTYYDTDSQLNTLDFVGKVYNTADDLHLEVE